MKLHLGCFNNAIEGWYNTDITPHIMVARIPFAARLAAALGKMTPERLKEHQSGVFRKIHYLNVSKPFPFATGSVEAIYSSHIIEHLYPNNARAMLMESLRVLHSGGICRVVAPSLEWALGMYSEKNPEPFLQAVFEHGHGQDKNSHKWMYTESSLVALLEDVGFVNVKPATYRQGCLPDVERLDCRPENSIYVEGVKA